MNLAKQQDTNSIFRNKRHFCIQQQQNIRNVNLEKIPFATATKNKVPRNKLSLGGKRPILRKLHNSEETNEGRNKWKHK